MVFLYYFPWNDFYICTDPCVRLDRLIIIKIIGWLSRGLYGIDSNFEILISIYIIRCLGRCYVTVDLYMKITYAIGVGIVCQHIITGECRHTCSIVCTKFGIFFCNSTIYKVIGCPISGMYYIKSCSGATCIILYCKITFTGRGVIFASYDFGRSEDSADTDKSAFIYI